MSDPAPEKYDLESVYDAEIYPLMTQIIAVCKKHRIPLLASFQYAVVPEDADEGYCTTYLDWPERRAHRLHRALHVIRPPAPPWLALTITTAQKAKGG